MAVSFLMILVILVGLLVVIGCAYWVMSGTSLEGNFRSKAQNLRNCPQCGTPLDSRLDYCPHCSLRISV
jgi:hypothetical protein